MTSLHELFQSAMGFHQAGQLAQAEAMYRQVLQSDPRHARALHLLGVLALQTDRAELAQNLISAAIRVNGSEATYHTNLGEAYRAAGQLDAARDCYRRAAELEPGRPQPHFYLALVHQARGEFPLARDCCQRALSLKPDYVEAHCALGTALRSLGERAAAQASFERAIATNPDCFSALLSLASVLREGGQFDRAREHLHRAIQLRPDSAEAHFFLANLETECENWPLASQSYQQALALNPGLAAAELRLGTALQAQKQFDAAVAHYQRAIELEPTNVEAMYNCGTALADLGRKHEAAEQYEAVIRVEPNHVSALVNLGAFYQDNGRRPDALAAHNRVLELEPDVTEVRFNRALLRLSQGELAAGWAEYDWRFKLPKFPTKVLSQPLWDGSPLPDKTLLVHAEQGFGDTVQFIRYLPLAKQRCAKVVAQVHDSLVPLLEQSGYVGVRGEIEELGPFDVQIPLMSLPGVLGTATVADIPAEVPYLSASAAAIARWRERLSAVPGRRVGIVWQGNPTHLNDAFRSTPLRNFAPLAKIAGVTLVCLQKHVGIEQLEQVPFNVHPLGADWDEVGGPFMDTVAVMKNLDLVITIDTVAAHMAGALGVPVWVALSTCPDWRWFENRDDSPWYPTMRLFRQTQPGDWAGVFARMAAELQRLVDAG